MEVGAWHGGSGTYGIRIGAPNRREHFDPAWKKVEIEMDGVSHEFGLTPGFWKDCPEIRDRGEPRLRRWLERHRSVPWPKGNPPRMELVPLGRGRFRLVP